jgi:hypothetical protein
MLAAATPTPAKTPAAAAKIRWRVSSRVGRIRCLDYLLHRGLALENDLGAADYRHRYFGASADRMVGHEFYRVAHARVIDRT